MYRKWFIPTLAVLAMTFLTPLDANAQLGKKGDNDKGGGKSNDDEKSDKSGGKSDKGSDKSDKGGGRSQDNKPTKSDDKRTTTSKARTQEPSRVDRDKDNRDRDARLRPQTQQDVTRKVQPSRSGAVRYGTSSNLSKTIKGRGTISIPEAPMITRSNRGDRDVYREDRTRSHSDFRIGYVQYNSFWNDDSFYYPHYAFSYNAGRCYPSPFYYYSNVPGYVVSTRVQIGNFSFQIFARDKYEWHRPSYRSRNDDWGRDNRYRYNDVDYAIDDIVTAFESGRMRTMQDLLPQNGNVQVALEDYANYRMRSEDFYDMLSDIVESTDTDEYRVKDVRYERDQVVIYAEHEFRDPYGRRDKKYHTIVLEENRRGYEISYFRVDRRRNW